jgi:hypothetical protein
MKQIRSAKGILISNLVPLVFLALTAFVFVK